MRVGLIGENPNDTNSFSNLFSRIYSGKFDFFPLIRNRTGGQLDDIKEGSKTVDQLQFEYEFEKPDFVVLIRDSDALETEHKKISDCLTKMYSLGNAVTQNAVFLLCIFEMETLLLADLEPINKKFGINLVYPNSNLDPIDPMHKSDPKGFLKSLCGYQQSDCPDLFKTIDFNKIKSVRFFSEFVALFEKRIK
ncbi:MAG: hypothetical protein HY064_16410 [Bacteroidetes bacterium]|nr:hypothetical protein [Bacteroidota bacterium]